MYTTFGIWIKNQIMWQTFIDTGFWCVIILTVNFTSIVSMAIACIKLKVID